MGAEVLSFRDGLIINRCFDKVGCCTLPTSAMRILQIDIPDHELAGDELAYLSRLQGSELDLAKIWELMDCEWENAGAGYSETHQEAVSKFYESPVWLLNGLFTECDQDSKRHRDRIAAWLAGHAFEVIYDYGGGYGSLARKIAVLCPNSQVMVVEPFPRKLALAVSRSFTNLTFVAALPGRADCIVAQDVLEHIVDPLDVFGHLLHHVHVGGYIVTANCFYPDIKCHLPQTFHLRYAFRHIVPSLGCTYVGTIPGVRHAQIFQKTDSEPNWEKARRQERLSKSWSRVVHPIVEPIKALVRPIWRALNG
ncbi:MAG: hypothetical protein CCU26_13580 [Nitrospira sp. UW-LDO-01]|nr:MAG: hypothetical protein CCU26_13580 [Nitrospira sp. UW-LDO-01]